MQRLFHRRICTVIWHGMLAVAWVVAISGCVIRNYAVILWANSESELTSGDVARISGSADSDEEVVVVAADGGRHRLYGWQIAQFRSQEELDRFLAAYAPYQHTFAQCEKKALPVRTDADRFSDILYRLDEGEIVKIIDRQEQPSNEAGLQDYWYYILTTSGDSGWVFGYHLSIINAQDNTVVSGKETRDNIAFFLNRTWRPAYFTAMKNADSFDLDTFDQRFGLFPAPLEYTISIQLPNYYRALTYRTPLPESAQTFYFGEQNELKITLQDERTVIAEITDEAAARIFEFHLFEDDIQRIINRVRAETRVDN